MMTKKKSASKKTSSSGKTTRKKAAGAAKPDKAASAKDFSGVFAALREILTPYEGRLSPREQGPGY
jgi:hypothetical protein